MKTKFIALMLALCLAAGMTAPALAAGADPYAEYTARAETLRSLGLFLGTDKGLELERPATRAEAGVMVVRLLGKEAEALESEMPHPFTDVPVWADVYIGYLCANGISNGISETEYGSDRYITPNQFGTLLLRALGYNDSAGDFSWNNSLEKMENLRIITDAECEEYNYSADLPRAYAAALSYACAFAEVHDRPYSLLGRLYYFDKAVTAEQLKAASGDPNVAALANLYGFASPAGGQTLTEREVYEKCHEAVFMFTAYDYNRDPVGCGSGFFISPDGYAITNLHVISTSLYADIFVEITGERGEHFHDILGILAYDPIHDLALIKVDLGHFDEVPYLEIGDHSKLMPGDAVYAIGSPDGVADTISSGFVQSTNHWGKIEYDGEGLDLEAISRVYSGGFYIMHSAPTAPGSSGGALINAYGQVIGVHIGQSTTYAGSFVYSLTIPAVEISRLERSEYLIPRSYIFAHSRYGVLPFGGTAEEGDNGTSPVQQISDNGVIKGSISDSFDVDIYSLPGQSAGTLFVSLTSYWEGGGFPRFEVIDSNGAVSAVSQHYTESGEYTEAKPLPFSLAVFGSSDGAAYTVRVYWEGDGGRFSAENVSYELCCARIVPPDYGTDYTYEFEPNNNIDTADYLLFDYQTVGDLAADDYGDYTDCDYYRIETDGSSFWAGIIAYNSNLLTISVISETGERVAGSSNGSESFSIRANNLPRGTYYIVVSAEDNSYGLNDIYYSLIVSRQT